MFEKNLIKSEKSIQNYFFRILRNHYRDWDIKINLILTKEENLKISYYFPFFYLLITTWTDNSDIQTLLQKFK